MSNLINTGNGYVFFYGGGESLDSITIAAATNPIVLPGTSQFTATGHYRDGDENITSAVLWASSDPTKATINNGNDGGLATGVADGDTNITATLRGVVSNTIDLAVASS